MKKNMLGNTGLEVSRLCFGGLTIGPTQANLPLEAGAELVCYAISKGLNFIDTAELYETYEPICLGIKRSGKYDTIVATKTYAYTAEMAKASLELARKGLDRDVIDIFLLHEQESIHTLNGHRPAYEFLLNQKANGRIKAVGLSTHFVGGVLGGIEFGNIDVIHPLFNYTGWGILDGSINDMENALIKARHKGIGIYGMKALGGGNLIENSEYALNFVLSKPYISSIAVGMQAKTEIDSNIEFFETGSFSPQNKEKLSNINRHLHIEEWCSACGKCAKRCKNGALSIKNSQLTVDTKKCVLCSYCSKVCENLCLKVL